MIFSEFEKEEDITDIIENTFNECISNKDEIRWLISILRGFMKIPHKRIEYCAENYKLNQWQYNLQPIIQKYCKKWKV